MDHALLALLEHIVPLEMPHVCLVMLHVLDVTDLPLLALTVLLTTSLQQTI